MENYQLNLKVEILPNKSKIVYTIHKPRKMEISHH